MRGAPTLTIAGKRVARSQGLSTLAKYARTRADINRPVILLLNDQLKITEYFGMIGMLQKVGSSSIQTFVFVRSHGMMVEFGTKVAAIPMPEHSR